MKIVGLMSLKQERMKGFSRKHVTAQLQIHQRLVIPAEAKARALISVYYACNDYEGML